MEDGIEWIPPLNLPPRIVRVGTFAALAAPLAVFTQGNDGMLAGHVATLAPAIGRDIDGSFDATAAAALAGLDSLDAPADDAAIASVFSAGDSVAADVSDQQAALPGPDQTAPTGGLPPSIDPEPPGLPWPWEGTFPTLNPNPMPPFLVDDATARRIVRDLYLELLQREPDAGGWDEWVYQMRVNLHTQAWVREQIIASGEYREKHPGGPPAPGPFTPTGSASPPTPRGDASYTGGTGSWTNAEVIYAAQHPELSQGAEWDFAATEARQRGLEI